MLNAKLISKELVQRYVEAIKSQNKSRFDAESPSNARQLYEQELQLQFPNKDFLTDMEVKMESGSRNYGTAIRAGAVDKMEKAHAAKMHVVIDECLKKACSTTGSGR